MSEPATVVPGGVVAASTPITEIDALRRRLERADARTAHLERLIEDKTRSLFVAHEDARRRGDHLRAVLDSLDSTVVVTDGSGRIRSVDGGAATIGRPGGASCVGSRIDEHLRGEVDPLDLRAWLGGRTGELVAVPGAGVEVPVSCTTTPLRQNTDPHGPESDRGTVWLLTDIGERRQLEVERRHAQKLEAIGSLAAGIAHEINTPIQFVGDSVHFLADALTDLLGLLDAYRDLGARASALPELADAAAAIAALEADIDVPFVAEESPRAIARTFDGIDRVARIVRAMKEFSHPGGERMVTDVGDVVESALTVATSEFKHIAELDFVRLPAPPVLCDRGDLGQVVLNLVVNAAHAIADAGRTGRGRIAVHVAPGVDGTVELTVSDNGAGIPAEVLPRIFDPFFTTKEPGRGTGQGLALARRVLDRHGGGIRVESIVGIGTDFICHLPAVGIS